MTSLGEDSYCGTLHYKTLDPPVIGSQNLQQTTDEGNSTTNDIFMNGGKLQLTTGNVDCGSGNLQTESGAVITDTIVPVAPNRIITLKRTHRGGRPHQLINNVSTTIQPEWAYGDIVQVRAGTPNTNFRLPPALEGGHLTVIGSVGSVHRLQPNVGESINGNPLTFIAVQAPDYVYELRVGNTGEWWCRP